MDEMIQIQFLGTLSNLNRIKILHTLLDEDKTVSQIIEDLQMNQTTISHNLKRLQICGFVSSSQEGKFRKYSINKKTIKPLLKLIDEHMERYCCRVVKDISISKKYKSKKLE